MRYPKFLKENGTIGVCAPSFGCVIEPYVTRMQSARNKFSKLGHNVVLTESVTKHKTIRSSSKTIRAKEFMQLYTDNNIDLIISEAGGEVMCEILPELNFKKITKLEPKWFLGYSDNTNLSFLLPTLCDVASIYGYCFPEFGMEEWHKSIQDHYNLLRGENFNFSGYGKYEVKSLKKKPGMALSGYNLTQDVKYHCLSKQKEFNVEGRVLAGCLDVLVNLCGTKFDKVQDFVEKYKEDGVIWFIESCDLNVLSQLRAFWQLKNAGWFENAKAIIIGRPANKEKLFGIDYKRANYSELKSLNIPVLIDADFGHLSPMFPIINGGYAQVSYKKDLNIKYILK